MPNILDVTILTLKEPNIKDFSKSRNDLLKTCKTKWALFVDQDEEVNSALVKEITSAVKSDQYVAYSLPRQDLFLGRILHHGENASNRFTRLVRVGEGRWVRPVHEVWEAQGAVGRLSSPLIHHLPDLTTFITKINAYSSIEAKYRYDNNVHSSLFKLAVFPFAKFFYNYILRLGFLDGIPGVIMAAFMAFHSYLTWGKLYLLWRQK